MSTTENVEQLHHELAGFIHAKDDEGVRRVYRELIRAGRSRLEVIDEVIHFAAGHYADENAVADADLTSWANLPDEIESNVADNAAAHEATRQVRLLGGHLSALRRTVLRPLLFAIATLALLSVSGLILLHWIEEKRSAATAPLSPATALDASASGSLGAGQVSMRSQPDGATSNGVSDPLMVNSAFAFASAPPPDEDRLSMPESGTTLIVAAPDLAIARGPSPSTSSLFGGVAPGARAAAVGTPKSSTSQVSRPDRRNSIWRASRERRHPAGENGSLRDHHAAGGTANTAGAVGGGATRMAGATTGGTVDAAGQIVSGTVGVLTDQALYLPPAAPTCPHGYMLDVAGCYRAR